MSKFNIRKVRVTNHQGWAAKKIWTKEELVKLCLSSFVENTFYETSEEKIERLASYMANIDNTFLMKLAIFSREYGLRSVNHLIAGALVHKMAGIRNSRTTYMRFIDKLVKRPDELWEILAAYNMFSTADRFFVPHIIKSAFKNKLENFSEYSLSKYKNKWAIKIHDICNLVHPKSEAISRLMKWELKPADTWEVQLSAGADKKETFTNLMKEKSLGAKAFLMNTRNMIEAGVDQSYMSIYASELNVKMIFPFDVMKSLFSIMDAGLRIEASLLEALEKLAVKTYGEMPYLKEQTSILCDVSGSMTSVPTWSKSKFAPADIAAFYSALAVKANDKSEIILFSDRAMKMKILPTDWVLRIYTEIKRLFMSWGTEVQAAIRLIDSNIKQAIVYTDGQFADSINNTFHLEKIIVANINDYKDIAYSRGWKVVQISGFTDVMLKYMSDLENIDGLVKHIESIEL